MSEQLPTTTPNQGFQQFEASVAKIDARLQSAHENQAWNEAYRARRNSAEVAELNDIAQVEVFGSEGRTVTRPGTGEVIADKDHVILGAIETIRNADETGKKLKDREADAQKYEDETLGLVDEGFELCQAKLIMDARGEREAIESAKEESGKDRQFDTDVLTAKLVRGGASEEDAERRAKAHMERKNPDSTDEGMDDEDFKNFIMFHGIFSRDDVEKVKSGQDLYLNPTDGGSDDNNADPSAGGGTEPTEIQPEDDKDDIIDAGEGGVYNPDHDNLGKDDDSSGGDPEDDPSEDDSTTPTAPIGGKDKSSITKRLRDRMNSPAVRFDGKDHNGDPVQGKRVGEAIVDTRDRDYKAKHVAALAGVVALGAAGAYLMTKGIEVRTPNGGILPDIAGGGAEANPDLDGVPDADTPSGDAGDAEQEFSVEKGNGYTHELIDFASIRNVEISPEQAWNLHQHLVETFGADYIDINGSGADIYREGGDIRLSESGSAKFIDGVDEEIDKWLNRR